MEIECSFLKGVKFRTVRSIKERIINFVTSGNFIFSSILISYFLLIALLFTVHNDKNTIDNLKGEQVYSHTIVIEKYNGFKDTIIYHDTKKDIDADLSNGFVENKKLYISTYGKNWMGFSFDSHMEFENVKTYKVLK